MTTHIRKFYELDTTPSGAEGMKSREDILNIISLKKYNCYFGTAKIRRNVDDIYKIYDEAMEEYASQFQSSPVSGQQERNVQEGSEVKIYRHKNLEPNILFYEKEPHIWINIDTGEGKVNVMLKDYMIPLTSIEILSQIKRLQNTVNFNVKHNMLLIKQIGEKTIKEHSHPQSPNIEAVVEALKEIETKTRMSQYSYLQEIWSIAHKALTDHTSNSSTK